MIKIVGLGPGNLEKLTIEVFNILKESKKIYCRTEEHPIIENMKKEGKMIKSYNYLYEKSGDFDQVYREISNDLVKIATYEEVVFVVPGNPLVLEKCVYNLIEKCIEKNIDYKVYSGISMISDTMERLKVDPSYGVKIIDAFDIKSEILDKRTNILITQIYNKFIASEVKIKLSSYYGDEKKVIYCKRDEIIEINLYELDRRGDMDSYTSVFITRDLDVNKDIYDLVELVDILRGENGCPWDKEQTHESIKQCMLEESYEVVDAIENDDVDNLLEELGDVLFQVVFHASIEKDGGVFNFNDVTKGVYDKMYYRHPHVFKELDIKDTAEVLVSWDKLKNKEKKYKNKADELEGVAKALPALIRASKVQSKMAKVGFDFKDIEEAKSKLLEQIKETLDVYKSGNVERITNEVGDLIFFAVNIARFLGVDSEEALKKSTNKFVKRCKYIEEKSRKKGKNMEETCIEEMNYLWESAKKLEKQEV